MHATRVRLTFFFFNDTAPTEIYTLSLHDALPICPAPAAKKKAAASKAPAAAPKQQPVVRDRKSTRLNSSHVEISYAVFCLKKKKNPTLIERTVCSTFRNESSSAGQVPAATASASA